MKKIYQIVVKGIATNKIYLHERVNYVLFKELVNKYKNKEGYIILTTNIYIVE